MNFKLPACVFLCFTTLAVDPAGADKVWNGKEWVDFKMSERGTPQGDLEPIRQMVRVGQNKAVEDAVSQFLAVYPEHPAREEAMFLAGQALMNDDDYWNAYEWFEQQITEFPNGLFFERALDREYRIADAYLKGRKRKVWKIFRLPAGDEGIDILTQIVSQAPTFEVSQQSLLRIADYYYEDESYSDACDHYDQFTRLFPRAEARPYAMYRAAKACLLEYRGVDHDKTPLLKAQLRFRTFAAAFPEEARNRGVIDILKEIRSSLAHKLFNTAAFYERVDQPGSALYYYDKVVKLYPRTEWAQTAASRLDLLSFVPEPEEITGSAYEGKSVPADVDKTAVEKIDDKGGEKKIDSDSKEEVRPLSLEDIIKMEKRNKEEKQE